MAVDPIGLVVLAMLVLLGAPIAAVIIAVSARRYARQLETRLQSLERLVASLRQGPTGPTPQPAPAAAPAPSPSAPPPAKPAAPVAPPPAPRPASSTVHATTPARAAEGWRQFEANLGGTWLSRIGALVLVAGIAFFLKYAFDNQWIRPAGRVTLGVLAGALMLLGGERLHRAAYRVPAQAVIAAGIGTLYLSVYAAYAFYALVPQIWAFAFMVLVSATALALALHHDARAVAILANIGAFITPILLRADRDAGIALFTYVAVLDAAMLASAYWRRWHELQALCFVFTQLLYWGWFERWYRAGPAEPQRTVALVAATVFLLLFAFVAPIGAAGRRFTLRFDQGAHPTTLLALAAPVAYFVAARAVLYPGHREWLALLCLVLTAFYAAIARWGTVERTGGAHLALFHWAIAASFLTLTFPVQFTEHGTTIAWSIEGTAIVWGGWRIADRRVRLTGLVVFALAAGGWLKSMAERASHPGTFVLDHPAVIPTAFFVLATAMTASIYGRRATDPALGDERYAAPGFTLASVFAAAVFLQRELVEHPLGFDRGVESVLTTMIWLVAGVLILARAPSDPTRVLAGAAVVVLVLVGLHAMVVDTERWRATAAMMTPVVNLRFASGVAVVLVYALLARAIGRLPWSETQRLRVRAGTLGALAFFLLWHLSAEIVLMPLDVVATELPMARQMGLSVLWTVYAFAAMAAGLRWRQPAMRFGALGLFAVTIIKVVFVDLSQLDAGYRILSFVVLGALLILASFVYTRHGKRILGDPS